MLMRWMNIRRDSVAKASQPLENPVAAPLACLKNLRKQTFYFQRGFSMIGFRQAAAGALAYALMATAHAQTTVSGVKYEDTIDARGARLQLNGAGVRYKVVVKVYAAGLYLGKKAATADEVLAAPGPKRMSITMLRDIDSAELGKLFSRGMEDNMDKVAFSKLIPGVMRMSDIFSQNKKLHAGDSFMIDWIPGNGTLITVKGQPQGEPFKEPEFFTALLRIWLGPNPADYKLKDALLGKAAG